MNDIDIEIEGGEVLAAADDRTITGLLIPFGEQGRTNVGQFEVDASVVELPADPSVVGLNTDHDRYAPVGRATRLWIEAAGVMASFAIAKTPAGDKALADARNPHGKRRRLSGEWRGGIKNGKATRVPVSGGALVARGAFPSAMVLAADTPDDEEEDAEKVVTDPADEGGEVISSDRSVGVYTDEDGQKYRRVYESQTTVTPITEPAAEAAPDQEESEVTASATIPATQRAGAPKAPAATAATDGPTTVEVMAAFAAVRFPHLTGNSIDDAEGVLAALADITTDLAAGGEVARPNWLGQLYQGVPYEREYITLGTLGTAITLGGKQGYTLHRGTAETPVNHLGEEWAGNKTPISSGVGFTKGQVSSLLKWAFGADIAREFFDLPGAEEAIEAFFRLVLEDHLIWSDTKALETWRTVAGLPIAAKNYPGVDGHDYGSALGMVIQGILAVKAKKSDGRRDTPTFIIANELAYEELIYTPKDLIPEFVNFTASTDWQGSGDGLVLVVGDTGITSTPSVIVGSGKAVEFDELPGGPLKIDALDLAKGGVDRAIHGYLQVFIVRADAVVHIGVADARANATDYQVGDLAKAAAVVYQAVRAGKAGGSVPEAPAVGATVVDGNAETGVIWKRLI
ncbi:hypothetical protein [Microbacterium sp. Leaf320]|uniref:hypothetical protein n=1 Tax=Microbacterium sp. Leaf320 TaxID=1736334 RepID=UPI0007020432|nr:hypothetical protein [Microbacterium sp. Leaf320]KQQ65192.1 hypothetical protein ASF63_14640 [Microbacterium sp. Leaf320]